MQDRDKLIERIRKLLAVTEGRGATEAEAIAAALAAQIWQHQPPRIRGLRMRTW